jgi:hypothetical protein
MAVQPTKYDDYGNESLAEHFLVKNNTGAVGYIGVVSKCEQGAWLEPTRGLCPYFYEEYAAGTRILGDLWVSALSGFIDDLKDPATGGMHHYQFIHIHKMILFGDPSLEMEFPFVNEPPVCDANGPYTIECGGATTTISLDGTGSSDPNSGAGDFLTYSWSTDCSGGTFGDPNSSMPVLSLAPGCYGCNVSLTVTDIAGESDTCLSSVTVKDTLPPTLSCPADVTIECDTSADPSNTGEATAVDVCDLSPVVSFSDEITPGTCSEEFTITRTWTAKDACGKESSSDQVIDVVDTTPPVITPAPDITIECDEPTGPSNTGYSTASDNCDLAPTVTYSDVEVQGDCLAEKTITRTWIAIDNCGNFSSHDQIIKVVDTTPPVISSVSASPDVLWPPNHKMKPVTISAVAIDNCDPEPACKVISVVSNEPINGTGDGDTAPDWEITGDLGVNLRAERAGSGSGREYTITVECIDDCSNSATADTTVTVPHNQ